MRFWRFHIYRCVPQKKPEKESDEAVITNNLFSIKKNKKTEKKNLEYPETISGDRRDAFGMWVQQPLDPQNVSLSPKHRDMINSRIFLCPYPTHRSLGSRYRCAPSNSAVTSFVGKDGSGRAKRNSGLPSQPKRQQAVDRRAVFPGSDKH